MQSVYVGTSIHDMYKSIDFYKHHVMIYTVSKMTMCVATVTKHWISGLHQRWPVTYIIEALCYFSVKNTSYITQLYKIAAMTVAR